MNGARQFRVVIAVLLGSLSCGGDIVGVVGGGGRAQGSTRLVATLPTTATSGLPLSPQPSLQVLDEQGADVPAAGTVTVEIASGTGTLAGRTVANLVNGVVAFTDLRINGAGPHTLRFTSAGHTSFLSGEIAVTQVAATLGIETQPDGAEIGLPFATPPIVRVLDHGGVLIPTAALTLTAELASGSGTLAGTTSRQSANGKVTFNDLAIAGSGPHSLRFSATGVTSVTTNDFIVAGVTGLALAQQPGNATRNSVFATQPVVHLRGPGNRLLTGAALPVTAAVALGSGTLQGTTTVNAVGGIAVFTDLQLTEPGPHVLTFATGNAPPVSSAAFTVGAPPASLSLVQGAAGAVAGHVFVTQPVLQVLDVAGAITSEGVLVTVSVNTAGAVLLGTTTVASASSSVVFTNLRLDMPGVHTLTFTAPGLPPVTTTVTVTQAPASLAVETQPGNGGTGQPLSTQPVVRVLDHVGQFIAAATTTVTAAIASGTGTLSGTTSVAAVAGLATFTNLAVTGGGTYTLTFSAPGLTPVTSSAFNVIQTPVSLAVQTQPGLSTSGFSLGQQPVVQVRDGVNALMPTSTAPVTAAVATGSGTLAGTLTVPAVNGVATFTNLVVNGSGPHTLSFTSPGLTATTSASFTTTQPPAGLAMQVQPTGAVSGATLTGQPVIAVKDASDQLAVGATVPVTAAIASGGGTLLGTTTVTSVAGIATFTNLRIDGSGPHTLAFTSPSLATATSAAITVSQTPTALAILTQPVGGETAQPLGTQPSVRVLDAAGVVVGGATIAVTASLASGAGTLSGTTTVAAVNGVATFTDLKVTGFGAHTLTFAATGLSAITSSAFTILQTPVALGFHAAPAGGTVGLPFTAAVKVQDAAGNAVNGSTAVVTVSIASGPGAISGTTSVAAVNGVATFGDLRLDQAGSYTLSFASTGLPTITSGSFIISQAPTQLAMQTQPAGAASGLVLTTAPAVRILDALNQLASGSTALVTAALASGTGNLLGTTTVNAVNGVASFTDLAIAGAGSHTLTFTSPGLTQTTSAAVNVTQTPASLAVLTHPGGGETAMPLAPQPQVQILDHAGLPIGDATNAVTAALSSGTGTLQGTTTVNAVNGIATFSGLNVVGRGVHSLTFTSASLFPATSFGFTITQTPASLSIQTQPGGSVSGVSLTSQPVVQVLDHTGALVLGATPTVTAQIGSGGGVLLGVTSVTAVDGVATFANLRVNGSGLHTLIFQASSNSLAVTSSQFTTVQMPAALSVHTQPGGAVSGVAMTVQPRVEILDGAGLPLSSATNEVTATLSSGTGTLAGSLTATASGGLASFQTLRISGSGAHVLTFSSPGLANVSSGSFNVGQQPRFLDVQVQPGGASTGQTFSAQPVVRILDDARLPISNATNPVTATRSIGSGILGGATTVSASNGLATFNNLQISGSGPHALTFVSGSLEPTNSATFMVHDSNVGALQHPSCSAYEAPSISSPLRTFYVDGTNGNDANDGASLQTAWKTLGKANSTAQAGDLFLIRGVFSGQAIRPNASGTPLQKIMYIVLPNDSARITLGQSNIAISLEGRSNIVVDGVEINAVVTPISITQGSSVNWLFNLNVHDAGSSVIVNSDDNRIEGSTFQRIGSESGLTGDAVLIQDGADRNVLVRNVFDRAGHATVWVGSENGAHVISEDNVVAQNDMLNPWAVVMGLNRNTTRTIVECNRIHGSANGTGFSAAKPGIDVDGIENAIRYNEIYQNGTNAIFARGRTFSATAARAVESDIVGNTLWGNVANSIRVILTFTP